MIAARALSFTPGDELDPLVLPPITRATLALFAGASGDHNPIHIDIDSARAAGMPDVFAHGMLSMAYLGRLLTDRFGPDSVARFKVRFVALTLVGDVIECRGRVSDVNADAERTRLTLELEAKVPARGVTTLLGEAVVTIASV